MMAAIAAAFVAGLVRGFSGFGGALIFMPAASALVGPKIAAVTFLVVDDILTLPMAIRSIRLWRWRTVLPTAAAAMATAPLGAFFLAHADTLVLRWAICGVVVVLLGLVASGIRYHREPHLGASLAVGAVSGTLGGIGQVSGPPVIAFWVAGPHPNDVIRANMFTYFALISCASFAAYFLYGLFTAEAIRSIVVIAPVYAVALFAGSCLFGGSASTAYRPLAYAVIALAAVTSMPVFDGLIR